MTYQNHKYSMFNAFYSCISMYAYRRVLCLRICSLSLSKVYSAAAGQTSAPPLPITHQHHNLMCPSTATIPQPKHPYGLNLGGIPSARIFTGCLCVRTKLDSYTRTCIPTNTGKHFNGTGGDMCLANQSSHLLKQHKHTTVSPVQNLESCLTAHHLHKQLPSKTESERQRFHTNNSHMYDSSIQFQ